MKAHKIEVLVIDMADIGIDLLKFLLESSSAYSRVKKITSCDWHNEQLLDQKSTADAEYKRLFG